MNTVVPLPSPTVRGLISGVILAGLLAAAPAEAQTDRTYTFTANIISGITQGPDCTACRANEGDRIRLTLAVNGITSGGVAWNTVTFTGSAVSQQDYTGGNGFVGSTFSAADESLLTDATYLITDDSRPENDETIIVAVPVVTATSGNPDTYSTTSAQITITIAGNDDGFSIAADQDTAAEDDGNITFTVSLAGGSFTGSRSVDWAVTGVDTAADLTNYPATRRLTFTANGEMTISLAITDDSLAEIDETLTVTLSNPSGGASVFTDSASAETVIEDNDRTRTLTVTGPATIAENDAGGGQESADYTVTLTGAAFATSTTVTWTVRHGGTVDADFVADSDRSGTVTFANTDAAGATKTFTLTVAGDALNEADESFTVQVSVATPGSTAYGVAHTTTIDDDDDIAVVTVGNARAVNEGGSTEFIVTLDHASAGVVTVAWTARIEGGGSTPDPSSGNLEIPAGRTAAGITIRIPPTVLIGAGFSRTLTVTLGDVTVATPGRDADAVTTADTATATVNYMDFTPAEDRTYTFTANIISGDTNTRGPDCTACRATEGDSFRLTLAISGISAGSARWAAVAFGGDAVFRQDYTGGGGFQGASITSDAESLVASFTYPITDDTRPEGDETITVAVPVVTAAGGNPDTYTTSSAAITITIPANDGNGFAIAAGQATAAEDAGDITFTVRLAGESFTGSRSVDWAVTGVDTAADLTNYPATRRLTFTANGEMTFSLTIVDDSAAEGNETLTVTLSNPSGGASVFTASAETVIEDNDQARTLTVTGASTHAETDSDTTIQYTVALGGGDTAFTSATTVTWTVTPGTAAAADFSAVTGTIEFPTATTFDVTVAGDDLNEAAETFSVQVSVANPAADSGTNYGAPARTTITDDDPVTVAIARAGTCAATVAESVGTCDFTVTIAGGTRATGVSAIVPFTVGGTVTTDDYAITAPTGIATTATGGSVTIAQSASSATITLTIDDDNINEATERITVTGAAVGGAGLRLTGSAGTFGAVEYTSGGNTAGVMITDNDDIASVTVADAMDVSEGGSTDFTVTLDPASAGIVTVAWTASIGGTMGGTPNPAAGTLAIPAGDTTADITIRIPPNADLGASDSRTLTVTLGRVTINAPGRGTVTTGDTGTATINYIDATHTISIADATVAEGASRITVTRTGPALTTPATVTWRVMAGTATAEDFSGGVLPRGTVTFAGASARETIRVGIADDALSEAAENFTIALTADDATLASNTGIQLGADATITIAASDAIRISVGGPRSVGEARTVRFPVRLSATPTADLTVNWAVAGGTATGLQAAVAGDFADSAGGAAAASLPSGMLTFTGGATVRHIELHTSDGGGDDTPDRVFTLTLSMASGGGGATPTLPAVAATVTITSDDPAAREARLEVPLMSAGRGVAQLAAAAVAGRMAVAGSGAGRAGNSLTLAGRDITGMESLAAHYLAGGYATGAAELSAAELLRTSGFTITGGGDRDFNLWGGGGMLSADGKRGGVDYDGDATAFHLGLDTAWRGGLAGVALGRNTGDIDFSAGGEDYALETRITGAHPYFGRSVGRAQMWVTAGLGSGNAKLKERGSTFKTDITVTTVAAGITRTRDDHLTAGLSALYTRAALDRDRAGGTLNAMRVDSLRVAGDAGAIWHLNAVSPYLDFTIRHDSGDGDSGIAGDLGGGVEYRAPTLVVRITAATTVAAKTAEETRAALVVRKSTGNFDLSLNLGADGDGVDTGRLVTGEWRF